MAAGSPASAGVPCVVDPRVKDGALINDANLPCPYPARKVPALMDLGVASLGWIYRSAQAVGSNRFDETERRARFYIREAGTHCHTPAELALLEGLSATMDAIVRVDADTRGLLGEAVSELAERFAEEVTEFLRTGDVPAAELRVTWGTSDRKAGTGSVHRSVERPGPVWVVVVKRERVDEWRAMWYFGSRELAEDGARRALGRDGNGGKVLETDVVEGLAYVKSEGMTQ